MKPPTGEPQRYYWRVNGAVVRPVERFLGVPATLGLEAKTDLSGREPAEVFKSYAGRMSAALSLRHLSGFGKPAGDSITSTN